MLSVPLFLNAPLIGLSSSVMFLNARQYALTWLMVEGNALVPGLSSIITISSGFIQISSMNPLIPSSADITKHSLESVASVFEISTASSKLAGVAVSLNFSSSSLWMLVPLSIALVGDVFMPFMYWRYIWYSQYPCWLSQLMGKLFFP